MHTSRPVKWPSMKQFNAVSERLHRYSMTKVSALSGLDDSTIRGVKNKSRMVTAFTLQVIEDTLDRLDAR